MLKIQSVYTYSLRYNDGYTTVTREALGLDSAQFMVEEYRKHATTRYKAYEIYNVVTVKILGITVKRQRFIVDAWNEYDA